MEGKLFLLRQLCSFVFLRIGLDVEIGEESEEEGTKEKDEANSSFGIIAVHEEGQTAMDGEGDELQQLHAGDVPLPPEVLLDLWPHGAHQVVEVHDHMNSHVQEHEEGRVSTAHKSKTTF